ncbi:hypothetical protein OG339_48930 (plasmid) [Streptosporangium sp. NBC_01495]|uniref:hypothetical protein n=1 Tax=Streptosporangium sp. NBC_01495 TaxID=2903899 RepID=UPI002E37DDD7|nr:hypothetical protein [Streptosporangium sp. NBC_01495]
MTSPPDPTPSAPSTPPAAAAERLTCQHCGDSFTRRNPTGRTPKYCPDKPCAAEAKAARLRDGRSAVDELLTQLVECDERHAPLLREQLRLRTELRERLLTRNADLEEAIKQADEQVAAAEQVKREAEEKAETAITDSRTAVREALTAQQRAQDSEREAWRAVGEHETRRTEAELAAEQVKRTAERDIAAVAKEREQMAAAAAEQQRRITELTSEVADRDTALAQAKEERTLAAEKARTEIGQLRADLEAAIARADAAETGRDKALAAAETARAETGTVRAELSGQITELRAELDGEHAAVRHAQSERDEARAATKITEARADALAGRAQWGEQLVGQLLAPLPPLEDLGDGTLGIMVNDDLPVLAEEGMVVLPHGVPEQNDLSTARALAAALHVVSRHADRVAELNVSSSPGDAAAESP